MYYGTNESDLVQPTAEEREMISAAKSRLEKQRASHVSQAPAETTFSLVGLLMAVGVFAAIAVPFAILVWFVLAI